jgi:hypothetical protein
VTGPRRRRLTAASLAAPVVEPPRPAGVDAAGVPLSEDQRRFRKDWGPAECVAELRRIAELDPTRVVTRNYFRVHSAISEATWNRHFGTFEEYKRQAGVILRRHAHRLEKAIAKHASVDRLREMNTTRREYEGRYLRPAGGRWQSALIVSDLHDKECDPFARRVVVDTARRVLPEKIIIAGDMFDLPEFSKHTKDPRSFDILGRIAWVHAFLGDLRSASPDSEIVLIEGNHEFRLLRHMSEETPALMVVLADLHGFTVPRLLGLDAFAVNYIARADMTAWSERDIGAELRKNYLIAWDSLLIGHYPNMREMGLPGASGHHHKHIVWPHYSPVHGPYEWHQIGAGHQREASYAAGEKWATGFLLAHVDTTTRRTQFEYIDLSHPAAMVGGKWY